MVQKVCKMTKIAKNTGVQALKLLKYRSAATKIAKKRALFLPRHCKYACDLQPPTCRRAGAVRELCGLKSPLEAYDKQTGRCARGAV